MRPDSVPWAEREAQPHAGELHESTHLETERQKADPLEASQQEVGRLEAGLLDPGWPITDDAATNQYSSATAGRSVPMTLTERALVTASGVRQPVVAILLAIAVFTVMAGKPLDGFLLAIVAIALAWDAGMSARQRSPAARRDELDKALGSVVHSAWAGAAAWAPREGRPPRRRITLGVAGAVVYSFTVGSFNRMSWSATAGVIGLGAGVVIIGWGGPTRRREIPRQFSRIGIITWASLALAACLWELGALLGQPTLAQSSYAHPTISTLTDPLLSTSLGRTVALLGWIGLGAFLAER
jgi:hypothetical protein